MQKPDTYPLLTRAAVWLAQATVAVVFLFALTVNAMAMAGPGRMQDGRMLADPGVVQAMAGHHADGQSVDMADMNGCQQMNVCTAIIDGPAGPELVMLIQAEAPLVLVETVRNRSVSPPLHPPMI